MNAQRLLVTLLRRPHPRCVQLQRRLVTVPLASIHTSSRLAAQFRVPLESHHELEIRELREQARVAEAPKFIRDDSDDGVLRDARGRPIPPRNPLDKVAVEKYERARRKFHSRRAKFAALAVVLLLAGPAVLMVQIGHPDNLSKEKEQKRKAREAEMRVQQGWGTERCDAPPSKDASTFHGKPVVVAPGGEKLIAKNDRGADIELVPTGTSSIPHFPRTIHLPGSDPGTPDSTEYTLIGLGVRSVSFLSIQVYVVGMYVKTSSLPALQSAFVKRINPTASALIPGEKDELRTTLLDAESSYALWDAVLRDTSGTHIDTAFRIVPTRGTDFNHLRDGWVTGIKARTAAAQKADETSGYGDEGFANAMRDFQTALAGRGSAPKASVIVLRRHVDGAMEILYQKKEKVDGKGVGGSWENLGTIEDERISRIIWLGYLGGKKVSSEGARQSVVEGCMELVERPAGTLATKVA